MLLIVPEKPAFRARLPLYTVLKASMLQEGYTQQSKFRSGNFQHTEVLWQGRVHAEDMGSTGVAEMDEGDLSNLGQNSGAQADGRTRSCSLVRGVRRQIQMKKWRLPCQQKQ